jgi:hypothetical protein
MSFQDIFEISQSISVNNHRTIGQQVSRSGQIRVAQYLTAVPWVFTVKPHNFLYYPTARKILNELEMFDRQQVDSVYFNSNNLKWFTSYQGGLTNIQLAGLNVASIPPSNATYITLKGLPTVSSTTPIFKQGDFIEIADYVYKVTGDVNRGTASTIIVYVNRPIMGNIVVGLGLQTGNDCYFYLLMESFPTYTLIPMTNGAFIQWDSDFVFREALGQF